MDDDKDRYWMPSTGSPKRSATVPTTSPAPQVRSRLAWCNQSARAVYGSYRKDDFADPETFLRQLAAVLERYDDATITYATSPHTGIQRTSKFPPSMAEVAAFCEEHIRRSTYTAQWNARTREQLREREERERQAHANCDEKIEQIKNDLRAAGFKFQGDRQQVETPEQVMAKHGISKEQWDAMPDADPGAWQRIVANNRSK